MTRRAWLAGGSIVVVLAAIFAGWYFLLSDRGDGVIKISNSPSPSPADVQAEIERDYLRHWEVLTKANLELRPELLEQVATGAALDTLGQQVQAQKDKDQPVRVRVEHNYRVVYPMPGDFGPDTATVEGSYVNHSVRLDPKTMQPIEGDPNEKVRVNYTMKKVDGRWKVAEIVEFK